MERNHEYKPSHLTIHKLSIFYNIPTNKLAVLAGAIKENIPKIEMEASRFAALSESFSKLTEEEKKVLDQFVSFLRSEESE